ncbi:GGDEF domain-containing protein [Vibrio sonorensis]|uniref:GGDEF domain-containing protein n=1 Tax=Vibrio sonorensis TaxID=1004316 RepID=UPI0008D905C9|nr:GGDEF domain-containing protein [Vibrio sonorensis]
MDIATLSIISVILAFTYSLGLMLLHFINKNYSGLLILSASLSVLGIGFLVLAFGNTISLWVSKVLANGLIAYGFVLLVQGLGQFRRCAVRYHHIAYISLIATIVGLCYFTFFHVSTDIRIILISGHIVLCLALCVLINSRGQQKDNTIALMILTVGLFIQGLYMLYRIAWTMGTPGIPDFMQAGIVQQLAFIAIILMIVLIGFSITWIITSRLVTTIYNTSIEDTLTRLYNRRAMEEFVPKDMARAIRHRENLSVVLLDIDNFKAINDTYGHQVGDSVLKTIARIVRHETRKEDSCFRYGGEEFLVLLPTTNTEQAVVVAEKLRKTIKRSNILPTSSQDCTASFGVASYTNETNWQELVEKADKALYNAKMTGRNTVSIYTDALLKGKTQTIGSQAPKSTEIPPDGLTQHK